jgi:hypothetical protein
VHCKRLVAGEDTPEYRVYRRQTKVFLIVFLVLTAQTMVYKIQSGDKDVRRNNYLEAGSHGRF